MPIDDTTANDLWAMLNDDQRASFRRMQRAKGQRNAEAAHDAYQDGPRGEPYACDRAPLPVSSQSQSQSQSHAPPSRGPSMEQAQPQRTRRAHDRTERNSLCQPAPIDSALQGDTELTRGPHTPTDTEPQRPRPAHAERATARAAQAAQNAQLKAKRRARTQREQRKAAGDDADDEGPAQHEPEKEVENCIEIQNIGPGTTYWSLLVKQVRTGLIVSTTTFSNSDKYSPHTERLPHQDGHPRRCYKP